MNKEMKVTTKGYTKTMLRALEYEITAAVIEVHKHLGPGLLERVYHICLEKELTARGINFISEMHAPLIYRGEDMDVNLKCDLLVENIISVELKAVDSITPIFEAQLLTYMKLLKSPKGLLFNFNCLNIIHEGKRSFVNEYYKDLKD